jgi:hypothetical protein
MFTIDINDEELETIQLALLDRIAALEGTDYRKELNSARALYNRLFGTDTKDNQ